MKRSDFNYFLPPERIAQHPLPNRADSRLLALIPDGLHDEQFQRLPEYLSVGDLLVFNDTQVVKARFLGLKDTGGRAEVLVERVVADEESLAWCQVGASKPLREGRSVVLAEGVVADFVAREGDLFLLRSRENASWYALMAAYGVLPLPPYIERAAEQGDDERYQTVFSCKPGAVAAPTAGLHFDEAMLARLREMGVGMAFVTLYVGAGTFQPVRADSLDDHVMHSERYEIPEDTVRAIAKTRTTGGRVIAVGTTSLRALESAAREGRVHAGAGQTALFIRPGYKFQVVDGLVTNFHLPESTLLMLVCAFAGYERVMAAYAHAVAEGYRFFSYGDAMVLLPDFGSDSGEAV